MEEVNITETESRYYSDLFNVCDVEKKASKVPNLKATEMFRSANLENDILKQVRAFILLGKCLWYRGFCFDSVLTGKTS